MRVLKPGRNDTCTCGSGKKYKKCCQEKAGYKQPAPDFPRAVALKPAEYNQLGSLFNAGRYAELETCSRNLLLQYPDSGFVWKVLAASLQKQAKDALNALEKATQYLPDDADAHRNLGGARHALGQAEAAAQCYRRALQIKPEDADLYIFLAHALKDLNQFEEVANCCRLALKIKPEYAEVHNNLGNTLLELGRFDEAVASYCHALELKHDYAEAYSNLGNALVILGQLTAAQTSCRQALAIDPDFADAHNHLGNALIELGQLEEAAACFRKAIELNPALAVAHNNLANVQKDFGLFEEAEQGYRRALLLKPDFIDAHSNILFACNYHPDLSAENIYREYQEFDKQRAIPLRSTWRAHHNDRSMSRRLRIGYVSPDFKRHSCQSFLEPLLAHHDKTAVEVYAYAELAREDELSVRFKGYVDQWIATKGMHDEILAERIRSDGIDILVDLAGHTAGNRLRVFARKPAPVSVSWLGYGYTTGLGAIDYYLSDNACVPMGSEGLFAEQPWRIETPAYVYRPSENMGAVSSLPALKQGYIRFGTLTRAVRINYRTIRVWAAILKAVPNSRLVINSRNFEELAMQERIAARFAGQGIARERLEIGYTSPPWDVLRGVDIGLDCFPHNSGTTLFESLYMGVPFITLVERPSVGRLGSSILQGIGHPEWIAVSEAEYLVKAVEMAGNLDNLRLIRAALRGQMEGSALRDEAGFARKVEAAYGAMFKKWAES